MILTRLRFFYAPFVLEQPSISCSSCIGQDFYLTKCLLLFTMKLDMGKKGTSSIIVLFSIIILCFLVIQISEFVNKVQADVDKLQIGTTSESKQTFYGTPELKDGMHVTGGNVGIGTTGPGAKLDIQGGALRVHGGSATTDIEFKRADGWNPATISQLYNTAAYGGDLAFKVHPADNVLATAPVTAMYIKANGNVGIGTTTPGATLDVEGEATVSGVAGDGTGKAVCIKSDGNFGTCTDAVGGSGTCTCS